MESYEDLLDRLYVLFSALEAENIDLKYQLDESAGEVRELEAEIARLEDGRA